MITLKESILDKDFDVDVADKYRGDNGEIRVEDYETFQFWLAAGSCRPYSPTASPSHLPTLSISIQPSWVGQLLCLSVWW